MVRKTPGTFSDAYCLQMTKVEFFVLTSPLRHPKAGAQVVAWQCGGASGCPGAQATCTTYRLKMCAPFSPPPFVSHFSTILLYLKLSLQISLPKHILYCPSLFICHFSLLPVCYQLSFQLFYCLIFLEASQAESWEVSDRTPGSSPRSFPSLAL